MNILQRLIMSDKVIKQANSCTSQRYAAGINAIIDARSDLVKALEAAACRQIDSGNLKCAGEIGDLAGSLNRVINQRMKSETYPCDLKAVVLYLSCRRIADESVKRFCSTTSATLSGLDNVLKASEGLKLGECAAHQIISKKLHSIADELRQAARQLVEELPAGPVQQAFLTNPTEATTNLLAAAKSLSKGIRMCAVAEGGAGNYAAMSQACVLIELLTSDLPKAMLTGKSSLTDGKAIAALSQRIDELTLSTAAFGNLKEVMQSIVACLATACEWLMFGGHIEWVCSDCLCVRLLQAITRDLEQLGSQLRDNNRASGEELSSWCLEATIISMIEKEAGACAASDQLGWAASMRSNAWFLRAEGRSKEALAMLTHTITVLERHLGYRYYHYELARTLLYRGRIHIQAQHYDKAHCDFEQARDIIREYPPHPSFWDHSEWMLADDLRNESARAQEAIRNEASVSNTIEHDQPTSTIGALPIEMEY